MAALVLTVLVLGPSLDAFVCGGEPAGPVATAFDADHGVVQAGLPGDIDHADEAEACGHGHCHHAALFVSPALVEIGVVAKIADRRAFGREAAPRSDRQFGLMRPPRA